MSSFRNEMDKAFAQAVNASPKSAVLPRSNVRAAEYLSRYMDTLLRKSPKHYSDAELEAKLTASITLFKYIEEKDIFRKRVDVGLLFFNGINFPVTELVSIGCMFDFGPSLPVLFV
ncbi:unnamed protein product [Dibothriocephalus latus]|uniref:Cullin family profile domain-containing protein n=1 Tax=Dibothriocephalus latus TaxID=60516 RepID=A0A3P6QMV2_DIBLA|nr:unnamed protein product [Dibothriocephalus latus]